MQPKRKCTAFTCVAAPLHMPLKQGLNGKKGGRKPQSGCSLTISLVVYYRCFPWFLPFAFTTILTEATYWTRGKWKSVFFRNG